MQEIKDKVRRFIEDNFMLGATTVKLADTDSFMERHIIDSTGFIELVTFLEESFGIKVEEEDMVPENLDSLERVGRYVQRKRG